MRSLICVFALALCAVFVPPAKADLLFVGSQGGGLCCFNVQLHQVDDSTVSVLVTLTEGARFFVDTGNDKPNHPGFAFNISGTGTSTPAATISNVTSPWDSGDYHHATTAKTGFGTFTYWVLNPGPGASQHNPGPLEFDLNYQQGLKITDFIVNPNGYYFAADILDKNGKTGMSAISGQPVRVPEPISSLSLSTMLFSVFAFLRLRPANRP